MTTIAEIDEVSKRLLDFVREVQAGGQVVLTQDHKPVARLVPASEKEAAPGTTLQIRSLKGHQVLAPVVSQSDLAEEMFAPR
jgi:prevent-host-death family protein